MHKQNTEFAFKELKFGQNGKYSFPSQEHVARGKVTYFANWVTSLMRDFGPGKKEICFSKTAPMESGRKSLGPEVKEPRLKPRLKAQNL